MEQVSAVMTLNARSVVDAASRSIAIPRLLVSVRSWGEATVAIEGGAQILDVKEPARGSLGMADPAVIREIAHQIGVAECALPLSIALGELRDWIGRNDWPALPEEVTFAKLGLSDLADTNDWQSAWGQVRADFDRQRRVPLSWVAVVYADQQAACSPSHQEILAAAASTRCAGLLIDTYVKSDRSLTDFVSVPDLIETAERCHTQGMFLALAGRLDMESLAGIGMVNADVIAIRSAACRKGDRTGTIDAGRVSEFREAVAQAWRFNGPAKSFDNSISNPH
jgi:hypothetical protein